MLRKGLLLAAATVSLSTAGRAADLPTTVPAAIPAPQVYNWTGFYVGAQVGGAFSSDGRIRQFNPPGLGGLNIASRNIDASGVIGGGHIGYNFQVQQWVIGLETDFEGSDANSGLRLLQTGDRFSQRLNWLGSVRGRLGYAIDNWLVYGTGGVAYGEVDNRYVSGVTGLGQTRTDTRVGWTAGAGVEYAFQPNWTARLEYRYTELERRDFNPTIGTGIAGSRFRDDPSFHTFRVGVSYRF